MFNPMRDGISKQENRAITKADPSRRITCLFLAAYLLPTCPGQPLRASSTINKTALSSLLHSLHHQQNCFLFSSSRSTPSTKTTFSSPLCALQHPLNHHSSALHGWQGEGAGGPAWSAVCPTANAFTDDVTQFPSAVSEALLPRDHAISHRHNPRRAS